MGLIKYIRNKKGQKRGVIVAVPAMHDNEDHEYYFGNFAIGWSVCNVKAGDSFDKKRGLEIAKGRAYNGSATKPPAFIFADIEDIKFRAIRYFKPNYSNVK